MTNIDSIKIFGVRKKKDIKHTIQSGRVIRITEVLTWKIGLRLRLNFQETFTI